MTVYYTCMVRCDHPGCRAKRALLGRGKGWVSRRERSWCPKHADQAPPKRVRNGKAEGTTEKESP